MCGNKGLLHEPKKSISTAFGVTNFVTKSCPRARKNAPFFEHYFTSNTATSERGDVMLDRADFEAVERVEAELDSFINKRSREREEANRTEAAWAESERRVVERRRETNRERWINYFEHMHRLHLDLAAEHANRRSRLMPEDEKAVQVWRRYTKP